MHEFEVLDRIFAQNAALPAEVLVPPGDDMALLRLPDTCRGPARILVAADSVIEGRHAPWRIDPFVLGRKAVLRNLSDVAAMGGARPIATIATAVLPASISDAAVWRLYEGIRETAGLWNAPLVGGDLATSPAASTEAPIVVSVTILAVPDGPDAMIATRDAARPGDAVFVTGTIGGAWDPITGLGRHLDFTPRVAVARELSARLGNRLGAMIDISDGLGRDLGHLASRSRVRIELELDAVPIAPGIDPLAAVASGEDYELAFTARCDLPGSIDGVPITRIGRVVDGSPDVICVRDCQTLSLMRLGFEHDGGGGA